MKQKNMQVFSGIIIIQVKWFEKSYQVFNKDYKKILRKANQKEKEGLFKKIIEMIK